MWGKFCRLVRRSNKVHTSVMDNRILGGNVFGVRRIDDTKIDVWIVGTCVFIYKLNSMNQFLTRGCAKRVSEMTSVLKRNEG